MTDPNPFDHGTTTIKYEPISKEDMHSLNTLLWKGWRIKTESISRIGAGTGGVNYRVKSDSGDFVLKQSRHSATYQRLIHNCMSHCAQFGTPVPSPKVNFNGDSVVVRRGVFCLYDFVEGVHYGGSRDELVSAAQGIVTLHEALSSYPTVKVIASRGKFLSHDYLGTEIERAIERGADHWIDCFMIENAEELSDASARVLDGGLETLPSMVTHNDLHAHNMLFDSKELRLILDYECLIYSQRARDVGFAMQRLARTFGELTERQEDLGGSFRARAEMFLNAYIDGSDITDEEIRLIPILLQDEALRRVGLCYRLYDRGHPELASGITKQFLLYKEACELSF